MCRTLFGLYLYHKNETKIFLADAPLYTISGNDKDAELITHDKAYWFLMYCPFNPFPYTFQSSAE